MATAGKNYSVMNAGTFEKLRETHRVMAGKELGLTGCEISLNSMAAGHGSPFLHTHTLNEEVYIVVRGSGTYTVDGETFPIEEGSIVRVAPAGVREMKAGADGMEYICIQAQAGSLTQSTEHDGVIYPVKDA